VPGSNLAPGTGPEVNPTAETPGSPTPTPAAAAAAEPEPAVSLAPHYGLPLAVTLAGALCLPLQPSWGGFRWLAIALVAFGGFLLLQARLLRLEFTGDGLVVWRGASVIRQFPYATWLGWRLFWPRLPVLFYFREERSIHLLPVLFDGAGLRQQLERRLAFLAPPPAP
jgi:hypothetical protein